MKKDTVEKIVGAASQGRGSGEPPGTMEKWRGPSAEGRAGLYLVGDAETGEAYVARLIPEPEGIYGPETRPLVQILRVAAYPRQHAIQNPGVALEIPAIPKGTFTRLSLIAEISVDDVDTGSYEISLRRAQQEALELAETEKEREIIRRHMAGEYYRRRLVKSYTREEVKFMVDQHARKKPEAENGIHQDLG